MKAAPFVAAVKTYLGKGYWYGTYCGHVSSEALLTAKARQYPTQYTANYILRSRRWLDGKLTPGGGPGTKVQDCVGLIKGIVWIAEYGGVRQPASDLSADGMYNKCTVRGAMASIPELPGVVVHYTGHIGVYIGGGQVIESRGVDYGVVQTALASRPWSGWGKCHLIDYTPDPPPPPDPPPDPDPDPDPEPDPDPVPPTILYKVQIGQFYFRENASALADRAIIAGFAATIEQEDITP